MAVLFRYATPYVVSSRQRISIRPKHIYTSIHSLDEDKYLKWENISEPMASVAKLA